MSAPGLINVPAMTMYDSGVRSMAPRSRAGILAHRQDAHAQARTTHFVIHDVWTISGFQVFIEPWLMSGGATGHGQPTSSCSRSTDRGFRFFNAWIGNASVISDLSD